MELHAYTAESWFTAEGARLKAARLKRAGLPNLTNWRFITLTVASRSISPVEAYEMGKDRLRRFLARLRAALGRPFLWCWKLEFHDDGYAHWHLLIEYKNRIPEQMLAQIEEWWGLGRTNVERVRRREMYYVFKYVVKGAEEMPQWVLNHRGRLRVFQTSQGFFSNRKTRKSEKKEPVSCLVPITLATRLGWDARKALLFEEEINGTRRVSIVKLPATFMSLLLARARQAIARRTPLAVPGAITISQHQAQELKHEHRKWRGFGLIPHYATAA